MYRTPEYHTLTPAGEIETRYRTLQKYLQKQELDLAVLIHPVDIYYYSGTMPLGHLIVPANGRPCLLVRRDLDRARAESPLQDIFALTSLKDLPGRVRTCLGYSPRTIGTELDILPVNRYRLYRALWPEAEWVDISPGIMAGRAVKSPYEHDLMRRAGDLATRVYGEIPEFIRPGLTEIELAGLISRSAYAGGHQNLLRMRAFDQEMFSWHVISGISGCASGPVDAAFSGFGLSPAFPMGAGHKCLAIGEPILVDFGICLDGYLVDLTRMFALGFVDDEVRAVYASLQRIEKRICALMAPGAIEQDLYREAKVLSENIGLGDYFLGPPGGKIRFVGHGVGLEINEQPLAADGRTSRLEEGMTMALELKAVLPGKGAVGLENTFVIRPDGPDKLTRANDDFVIVSP